MGWALIFDENKGYYDLQINPKTKTFITTDDVGDFSGIIEMLKYTLGTYDDPESNADNDPNFTQSGAVFNYYDKTDPRGTKLNYITQNFTGETLLQEIKTECERATKPLLNKEFKNKKICKLINFTPRKKDNTIILDIIIFFTDNTTINTTQVLNSL